MQRIEVILKGSNGETNSANLVHSSVTYMAIGYGNKNEILPVDIPYMKNDNDEAQHLAWAVNVPGLHRLDPVKNVELMLCLNGGKEVQAFSRTDSWYNNNMQPIVNRGLDPVALPIYRVVDKGYVEIDMLVQPIDKTIPKTYDTLPDLIEDSPRITAIWFRKDSWDENGYVRKLKIEALESDTIFTNIPIRESEARWLMNEAIRAANQSQDGIKSKNMQAAAALGLYLASVHGSNH